MEERSNPAIGVSTLEETGDHHGALSPYRMHIIIQPPREARPGHNLVPPLTIFLRARNTDQDHEAVAEDTSSYWASVSLVSEDGMIALAPPSTTLLSGTLVDSIREPDPAEDEGGIGYVLFERLAINQPGNFRLRISLPRMPTGDSDGSKTTGGSVPPSPGVLNTGSVVTRVICIHDDAPVPRLGEFTSGLET